jgi:NAD(P)H-dependent flavin oxidoreductase YrpB (nitropropane dioxygenase family)
VFLAIVSSHVLALFLAREEAIRPDGFIVEAPPAGGHNAPPRRPEINERGEMVFGPRDEPDLDKIAVTALPYWLAGAAGTPEALLAALNQGAMGIQVGTIFALSSDSGIRSEIRDQMQAGIHDDSLYVRTDPVASPTGFPFKVAEISGTLSETSIYEARPRLCDLGYLRTAFVKTDGDIGYRCPSEPVHMYVRKGGDIADTVGRQCLCNGLTATVGLAQLHAGGYLEAPVATLGSDLAGAKRLAAQYPAGWSAVQVIDWLESLSLDSPRIKQVRVPSAGFS